MTRTIAEIAYLATAALALAGSVLAAVLSSELSAPAAALAVLAGYGWVGSRSSRERANNRRTLRDDLAALHCDHTALHHDHQAVLQRVEAEQARLAGRAAAEERAREQGRMEAAEVARIREAHLRDSWAAETEHAIAQAGQRWLRRGRQEGDAAGYARGLADAREIDDDPAAPGSVVGLDAEVIRSARIVARRLMENGYS